MLILEPKEGDYVQIHNDMKAICIAYKPSECDSRAQTASFDCRINHSIELGSPPQVSLFLPSTIHSSKPGYERSCRLLRRRLPNTLR